jgi:DNA-binding NarL/FixJ family response regulator
MIRHVSRFVQQCSLCGPARRVGSGDGAPKVLLAEHRDEVFARLAADLAQAGLRVIRATTAQEAVERHRSHRPILAIVNRDLPHESGWLLVAKLHLAASAVRVWVYQPTRSPADVAMARFFGVDALVDYGGRLFCLSDAILDCLAGRSTSPSRSPWHQTLTGADAA